MMDPNSILHALHKLEADRSSNIATNRSSSHNDLSAPPPPYAPPSNSTPALLRTPLVYRVDRDSTMEEGEDVDDDHTDLEDACHHISINASTTISGLNNVVQIEAGVIGARIVTHLVTLLKDAETELEEDSRRTSHTTAAADLSNPTPRKQSLKLSRPVRIVLDVSTKVSGTKNILGGPGMRIQPVPSAVSYPAYSNAHLNSGTPAHAAGAKREADAEDGTAETSVKRPRA